MKIGDFGMATKWPAQKGIDGEGDRTYMSPEVLNGKYDRPADIFALGLIMFEIAGNVVLPQNGPSWTALRNGDMSAVQSLTETEPSASRRDATGMPISQHPTPYEEFPSGLDESINGRQGFPFEISRNPTYNAGNLFGSLKRTGISSPPPFMTNKDDNASLDKVVAWMITPGPKDRPAAQDILNCSSVRWIESRCRAPATVFEGVWGPKDPAEVSANFDGAVDTEMTDV